MHFVEIFLISIGLAMDAFAVSLTEGLTLNKLKKRYIFRVAVTFGIFQGLMPYLGWILGGLITEKISHYGDYIAFALLVGIGSKMLYEAHQDEEDEQEGVVEKPTSNIIALGIATSIDALAVGVTFSFVPNIHILEVIFIIGGITFIIAAMGVILGNRFGKLLGSKAEYLGGAILVVMGIKMLL
ncbi:MAG: manganese efflux pump MntP family protein [Fusobacteriaceae bacterium]